MPGIGANVDQDVCTLESLEQLTGIPAELIQKELLLEGMVNEKNELSMNDLRVAMIKYLDTTMFAKK